MSKPCAGYSGLDRTKPCRLCGQKHAAKGRPRRKKKAEGDLAPSYGCFHYEVSESASVSCQGTWKKARAATARADADSIPAAITREPNDPWLVTLRLEDFLAILSGMQMNAEALREAQSHVFRQGHYGRHEQDRWDAYQWWQKWGSARSHIHPVPKEPKPPKKRRG